MFSGYNRVFLKDDIMSVDVLFFMFVESSECSGRVSRFGTMCFALNAI